jgi:hypothetical protein
MERSTLDAAIDSYENRFYSQKKGTIHSTLSQTVLHLKFKVDRMNGKGARTKRRTARSQEKRPGQIETPIRSITKRPVYYWVSLIFLIHAFGLILLFGVPWLMYFAARNLFFDRDDIKSGAALVATFLGTAYWWNSLPREMFFYGMVGYAPASYASVLGVTLLYRIAKTQSLWIAQPALC